MIHRAVVHRRADRCRDHGRLGQRELFGVLAEEEPRGRFDAIRAVSEVHLIRVQLEDLILGEVLLDLDGEERFVDLAAEGFVGREEDLLGELLRQRRRALRPAPLDDVP